MSAAESRLGLALRALQRYDELTPAGPYRYHLIEAETLLGGLLGLECTGEADACNADGSIALYSHNGDTCPIHEWLVPADQSQAQGDVVTPAVGDRVEFVGFGAADPYTRLEPGTMGTVTLIDDAGTVHVTWDNGSHLGMVTRPFGGDRRPFVPDRFRVVSPDA